MDESFRLEAQEIVELPRLAWCARLSSGSPAIELRHGSQVEVDACGFVAGAWDGPFAQKQFQHSASLCGTGGVVEQGSVVFASPFHPLEWLFAVEREGSLWISNSLPFVLTASGEELDLRYPGYFFDLLNDYRLGVGSTQKRLVTRSGRGVATFACCSIRVWPDLRIEREEKQWGPEPSDYGEYAATLQQSVSAILDNARSPDRKLPLGSVATVSRGYDSVAAAALAAGGGCKRAVALRESAQDLKGTFGDDSGKKPAEELSMSVVEFDRGDFRKSEPLVEAEFFMTPMGKTNLSLAAVESELRGCVLVTGRHGENLWRRDSLPVYPNLEEPQAIKMSGSEATEYFLRNGAIHLPAPYLNGIHGAAIRRISHSREMQPWSIGGEYDRPIARRIAEEAGVSRESFGQIKMGGGGPGDALREEARRDFDEFYGRQVRNGSASGRGRRGLSHGLLAALKKASRRAATGSALLRRLSKRYPVDRLHPVWGTRRCYRFHWGVWRTSVRYQSAAASFEVNERAG